MEFKEMTLEDIIWDNSQSPEGRELLKERGLVVNGFIHRQMPLGQYGKLDLLTIDYIPPSDTLIVTIYELKKGKIGIDALLQACRYIAGIKHHGIDSDDFDCEIEYKVRLIGDSIDKNGDFVFLYNELNFVDIYIYNYTITGITFTIESKCWRRSDCEINNNTSDVLADDTYHFIDNQSCE